MAWCLIERARSCSRTSGSKANGLRRWTVPGEHGYTFNEVISLMANCDTQEKRARVARAFMQMKKFDIEKLNQAYRG